MATATRSVPRSSHMARIVDRLRPYAELTKPRIVALQLVTTACAMLLASSESLQITLLLATLIGGALVSGSSAAMNHVLDRDLDSLMERTKGRPLPSGRVTVEGAMVFAVALGTCGLVALYRYTTVTACLLALSGHVFYILIYTVWLKRRTAYNIVIGGAAGGVPPLVGWAAVTGQLSVSAFLMFLLVFLWTPPHFWALALHKNDDYRRAGVPMLPVVSGELHTSRQMLWYGALLTPCTVALWAFEPRLGPFALISSTALGMWFVSKCVRLVNGVVKGASEGDKARQARRVFASSITYLFGVFASLVLDALII